MDTVERTEILYCSASICTFCTIADSQSEEPMEETMKKKILMVVETRDRRFDG